jgi:hypothetical protein
VAGSQSGPHFRLFDEVLSSLQDPAMGAANALGRKLMLRDQEKVAELVDDLP